MKQSNEEIITRLRHENAIMRRILEQIVRGSWGIWESFVIEVKKTLKEIK